MHLSMLRADLMNHFGRNFLRADAEFFKQLVDNPLGIVSEFRILDVYESTRHFHIRATKSVDAADCPRPALTSTSPDLLGIDVAGKNAAQRNGETGD